MLPAKNPAARYREQQVFSASPLQRLLMVYDAAIVGCNKRDLRRTTEALNLLRNSLDYDYGDASQSFFRLYQYCADQAREGNFEEAARVLRELVQAWVEVLVRDTDARTANTGASGGVCVAG